MGKIITILSITTLSLGLLVSCGGSSTSTTLGTDETAATITATMGGTYNLVYNEINTGSGIANGTTTTFVVATDGTLTLGSTVLSGPYNYKGNTAEIIWRDPANSLNYALSFLVSGAFNEINVANNKNFDETGFQFYGQYR